MSLINIIAPIEEHQRQQVISSTRAFIDQAGQIFGISLPVIPVHFDLKGCAAGMFCVRSGRKWIRYNPYIFAKYFSDNLCQTIPHEVAHYVIDHVYGHRRVRPHGKEWQGLMRAMGIPNASRTCQYDLSGIPTRRHKQHDYACGCRHYQISTRRHNKIQHEGVRYYCRVCQQMLIRQVSTDQVLEI